MNGFILAFRNYDTISSLYSFPSIYYLRKALERRKSVGSRVVLNVDKVLEIIDKGLLGIFVGEMMKQLMTHLLVLEISLALGL